MILLTTVCLLIALDLLVLLRRPFLIGKSTTLTGATAVYSVVITSVLSTLLFLSWQEAHDFGSKVILVAVGASWLGGSLGIIARTGQTTNPLTSKQAALKSLLDVAEIGALVYVWLHR